MPTPIYFLTPTGSGATYNGALPNDAVACTQAQAQTPTAWAIQEGQIVPNPTLLAQAQSAQIQILSDDCRQSITSGFHSSALGAAYIYAAGEVDQRNLVQSAQCAKGGLLSCQDNTGAWARKPHTQAQAQQVLEDFVTSRDDARLLLEAAQTQVQTATTIATVQAVVWEGADIG